MTQKNNALKLLYEDNNESLHPVLFCVHKTGVRQYYVVAEGVTYLFPTILRAVEVCLMLHSVFNLQYNKPASNTWIFLQRFFFNIRTETDKRSPKVSQLEKSLSQFSEI